MKKAWVLVIVNPKPKWMWQSTYKRSNQCWTENGVADSAFPGRSQAT